jgi:hypothetical protein
MSFVPLCAINETNDIVDLAVDSWEKQLRGSSAKRTGNGTIQPQYLLSLDAPSRLMPLVLSITSGLNDGPYQGGSFDECLAPKDTAPPTGDIIGNAIQSIALYRLGALGETKVLSIFR